LLLVAAEDGGDIDPLAWGDVYSVLLAAITRALLARSRTVSRASNTPYGEYELEA
jgi:hypothetical protein